MDPAKANNNRTVQDFRKDCLRELKKIKLAWPELNYSTAPGVLILHPSTPSIAPLNQLAWPELNYSTAPGVLILHPSTPSIAPLNQGQLPLGVCAAEETRYSMLSMLKCCAHTLCWWSQ